MENHDEVKVIKSIIIQQKSISLKDLFLVLRRKHIKIENTKVLKERVEYYIVNNDEYKKEEIYMNGDIIMSKKALLNDIMDILL